MDLTEQYSMVENLIFCLEVAQKCKNIKFSCNSCLSKLSTWSSLSSQKNEYPGRFSSPKSAYTGFLDLKTQYPGLYLVYLVEQFRHATFYLAEQFHHATFYLAEQFRHTMFYFAELFRQIAFPNLK